MSASLHNSGRRHGCDCCAERPASRLQTVSTRDGGVPTLVSYSYLTNSSLVGGLAFQHNGATRLTTTKTYDHLNRLTAVQNSTNAGVVASSVYGYNAASQRTAVTNADGSFWRYGYDVLGQVTNGWRYWSDGSAVLGQTFNYQFDDIGNRQSASSGASNALRVQNYSVNSLNQYTNRTVPGYIEVNGSADTSASVTVNGSAATRQGEYFRREVPVDNTNAPVLAWLTNQAVLNTTTSLVSRLSKLPRGNEDFAYDADGNLTQDGLWTYTWDAENRLTRIQSRTNLIADSSYWQRIDCVYDYMSRRVRKQVYGWTGTTWTLVSAHRFCYDAWNLLGQVDELAGLRQSFLWGTDLSGTMQGAGGVGGLLAMMVHNGTNAGTYFHTYDGNGNVAALLNAADGTEAARYEYSPAGQLLRSTDPLAKLNPLRFSTRFHDDQTGFIYFREYVDNANLGW